RGVTAGKAGRKLKVGIRPDNIQSPEASARGETAPIEVNVDLVEPLGNEVIVHSHLADNSLVFRLPPQHSPTTGAKLKVLVELESLHLFDAETELRLSP
ncbi:MAG TPA: TOBE domain-containing protein, partial [Cystobacter sp.]